MSFDAIARLLSGQRPFHLYQFTRAYVQWFFTGGKSDIVTVPDLYSRVDFYGEPDFYNRTWEARAGISHARIPDSSEQARNEFPVTFPLSDTFARQFLSPEGRERTTVSIWKGYTNDPDGELVLRYTGDVVSAKPNERRAEIDLVHQVDGVEMSAAGLPQVIQQACPYAIYHTDCNLDLAVNQVDGEVTAVTTDGLTLTVAEAALAPDGTYRAGIIEYAGLTEAINSHTGDTIVLEAPLPGLAAAFALSGSEAVKIAPGCRQMLSRCADLGNSDNFGAFPWLLDTPFDGRSIV